MLSKYRQKRQEGFTIIEVLIVLAIAGLILLVVFLAVPALQRNSRNTQRDNDVAGILGGMSEYVNNNNGTLPTAFGNDGATKLVVGATGTNRVTVNLGYYSSTNPVQITLNTSGALNNPANENTVVIVTGAKCGTGNSLNDAVAGASRGYVALYTKENGAEQCKES